MGTRIRIAAGAALCLTFGCQAQETAPELNDIWQAMEPLYTNPIDTIQDFSCQKRGPSTYQCDFKVWVIGLFPEQRTECMQSGASGWTPVEEYRCMSVVRPEPG